MARCTRLMAATLALVFAREATAQRVTGPWEDGTIAPRGVLRIGISPRFEQWKERYDRANGKLEPLGADFTRDSLGPPPAFIPFVAGLAPALTTLTGLVSPPLSLGTLDTKLDVTQVTTHITLDYGISSRIGIQALIPYVKNRVHVTPISNAGGVGATLGFNPAQALGGAKQQNDLVVSALGTAASTLTSELARCLGLSDPACSAINANRAAAVALVQSAGDVSTALSVVYGTTTVAGALYAPVANSVLQHAVDAKLASLSSQFQAFLGAAPGGAWIAARPVSAVPMAANGLDALIGGAPSGIIARPLGDYEHSHVGDIEVGAKVIFFDTFASRVTGELPRTGSFRLAGAGFLRLGTGQLDLPEDFTDVGTGDRQRDIELRGYGDIAIRPRLWLSSVVRLGVQQPDRLVRRVTDQPGDPFPELARTLSVDRDLGNTFEFEASPRYLPNDEFGISAIYRYRTKGADTYSGTFEVTGADGTPLTLNASTLGIDTEQHEQMYGFAVTYSTVRGYSERSARWPLEISFLHTQVFGGKGVPRMAMNGVALRLYRPVAGNSIRGPDAGKRRPGTP